MDEINKLCGRYGDEFNWGIVSQNNDFVSELEMETDISQYNIVIAVARSYSNDDVLFFFDNTLYRIYHLTYSKCNAKGFPKYEEFYSTKEVAIYLEKQFINQYL